MAFELTGYVPDPRCGQRVVRWDAGELGGEHDAVKLVESKVGEVIPLTPTGPFITGSLDDPVLALQTLGSIFFSYRATGDVPEPSELPPIPPGAVA